MSDEQQQTPPQIRGGAFGGVPQPRAAEPVPAAAPAATGSPRRTRMVGLSVAVAAAVVAGIVVVVLSKSGLTPTVAATTATTDAAVAAEQPSGPSDDVVKAMFKRRSRALLAGDETTWLADLDPANAGLIAQQKRRFSNLRQLGLKTYDEFSSDIGIFPQGRLYGLAQINELMQLTADVERSKTVSDYALQWTGGKPVITSISPDSNELEATLTVPNPPWDQVALRSVRADGVTILAPVGGRWNPATYLPGARKAASLVRSLWGKRSGVPGFVVFLADHQQFTTWLTAPGAVPVNAIADTTFPRMVEDQGQLRFAQPNYASLHGPVYLPQWKEQGAGARIVVDMTKARGVRDVEQTLAHEMTHAMSANLIQRDNLDFNAGKGNGPSIVNQGIWPIEGFAAYVEYLDNPSAAAPQMAFVRHNHGRYRTSGLFPATDDFYSKDLDRINYNYDLSSSLFLAADKVGGRQKALNLYIALTNTGDSLSQSEMFVDPIISQCGLDPKRVWSVEKSLVGFKPDAL